MSNNINRLDGIYDVFECQIVSSRAGSSVHFRRQALGAFFNAGFLQGPSDFFLAQSFLRKHDSHFCLDFFLIVSQEWRFFFGNPRRSASVGCHKSLFLLKNQLSNNKINLIFLIGFYQFRSKLVATRASSH